jgi:hypothetical protein
MSAHGVEFPIRVMPRGPQVSASGYAGGAAGRGDTGQAACAQHHAFDG